MAMPTTATSVATVATPTPLRIIISAFGRGRGYGSAPLPKAVMIKDSRKIASGRSVDAQREWRHDDDQNCLYQRAVAIGIPTELLAMGCTEQRWSASVDKY